MRIYSAIALLTLLVQPQSAMAAGEAKPTYSLSRSERAYYGMVFSYAMETLQGDQAYDWDSHSIKGKIMAGDPFKSKSGAYCRHFSESYAYQDKTGVAEGIGCKRSSGDGWCKIRPGKEITACVLEKSASRFNITMPGMGSSGFLPDFPDIDFSVFGLPNVSVSGPNIDTSVRSSETPTGAEIADTVTGTAGAAAGATGEAVKTFLSK